MRVYIWIYALRSRGKPPETNIAAQAERLQNLKTQSSRRGVRFSPTKTHEGNLFRKTHGHPSCHTHIHTQSRPVTASTNNHHSAHTRKPRITHTRGGRQDRDQPGCVGERSTHPCSANAHQTRAQSTAEHDDDDHFHARRHPTRNWQQPQHSRASAPPPQKERRRRREPLAQSRKDRLPPGQRPRNKK